MATVTAPILLDSTGQQILSKLEEVSILPQIVDNLTTSDAAKALSAKQGKILYDAINDISNTSGVAEQGTNYIRYNSGVQICWGVFTSDGATHTTESWGGGIIHTETFSPVKAFPKSFISYPSLTCTREYSATAIFFLGVDLTLDGISKIWCWRPDTNYYGFGYMDYIAIGRWK